MPEADRTAYLAALSPGADIDHRGTSFTPELLSRLLDALTADPTTDSPHIGDARFEKATFSGDARFYRASFSGEARFEGVAFSGVARFGGATFSGPARFEGATFAGVARFGEATFSGEARFEAATFSGPARFGQATFSGETRFSQAMFSSGAGFRDAAFSREARFSETAFSGTAQFKGATFSRVARFGGATFSGPARFSSATFSGTARFSSATFSWAAEFDGATFSSTALFGAATFIRDADFGRATFEGDAGFNEAAFEGIAGFAEATFSGDVNFSEARFELAPHLGPLVGGKRVVLDGAVFQRPVTVEIAARHVSCARTRWVSTATLHLRYAELDLRDAVFEYPVLVAARPDPFLRPRLGDPLSEAQLSGEKPGVRLASVGGVDAAHLALHDIDLKTCRLAGAVHLDQMKVDGWCTFATTPTGWNRRFPWRWSRRNTLVEEHHWRVLTARGSGRGTAPGWTSPPPGALELKPVAVAALYRQLRKSLEDGKNEPDAADFYYGECEMRRHDSTRPFGERVLLTAYWALSGYGLRAVRALAWLVAAMVATITMMVLWGLPVDDPNPQTTGKQVSVGQNLKLTTDTPDPRNPTGPLCERVTTERFDKAVRVVINSVVFRSSGQDLTTFGTYTEMLSRLTEPVLLGLAVLAVRSRVKR
ncbi:pentapeptide repeat-containing protein [Streptomyces swartbergensis]|uniref:pentapeptide repeat-containing protein n=1 Tax=Streptomyces swartbergensis TaxID=487165 RepID=UPI001FC90299|nr:pentapeptide repeat-containing protein [Streptomyces swartbergensis]